jgi:hypothetical protein
MVTEVGKYYLYRHIRLDKNEPFYIGVGTKHPKQGEYNRAFSLKSRNNIWQSIYNKTDIQIEILIESDDDKFISKKEVEFIHLYGRICKNDGTLANIELGNFVKRVKPQDYFLRKRDKCISQCMQMSKNRIGTNHFYKNVVSGYAYYINGEFAFNFKSGVQAATIIGNNAIADVIIRKIDKGSSYKGFFFSKYKKDVIDTTGFRINQIGKDYGIKKVLKIGLNGETLQVFNSIKEAAISIGMHKDSLSTAIRKGRKTRKGIFKFAIK